MRNHVILNLITAMDLVKYAWFTIVVMVKIFKILLNRLNTYFFFKLGMPAENPEIWFLDRSLQWHFLATSFTNYYRLLIAHLGLPQWQMLFTDDGLPPMLYVREKLFYFLIGDFYFDEIFSF